MSDTGIRICPRCREKIGEDDDFVVCSVCRTPHHTKCWLETKHCSAEGCSGESTSSGYAKTDSPFFIRADAAIVRKKSYDAELSPMADSDLAEDFVLMELVKRKAEYYLPKFAAMDKKNSMISFNLAACLLGGYWSFYRKLYLPALILMAVQVTVMNLPINPFIIYIIEAMLFLTNGLFGNYLYKRRIYRCRDKAMKLQGNERSAYIALKSGVNVAIPILMLILFSGISIIRAYLPFALVFFKFFK